MIIFGGLRPIASQVVIDCWALFGFGYVTVTRPTLASALLLGFVASLTIWLTGNMTNRWTITFPMIPLLFIQYLRHLMFYVTQRKQRKPIRFISVAIGVLSLSLILISGALSILFPPVELPWGFPSLYNVGVVDTFFPVNIHYKTSIPDIYEGVQERAVDHVTVRILYPTMDEAIEQTPYLKLENAEAFCSESMRYAAPPPLQTFDWMLHMWRLAKNPAIRNATPLFDRKSPIIAFSHGLGGNADIYSYQTVSLAANGYVVVIVEHSDGSGPVVSRQDGSMILRQRGVEEDWHNRRLERYRRSRRAMVEFRAEELLAAVESMISLNNQNIPALESLGVSFVGRLDTDEIHYMGHSFGASTVLDAALKWPPTSVIAHDPVSGWLPNRPRFSLYDPTKLEGSEFNYSYYWVDDEELTDRQNVDMSGPSIHDINTLILFSHEWHSNNWEGAKLLHKMHTHKRLGREGRLHRVQVIDGAHHNEFSDISMLIPTWLARKTGMTGSRRPLDTAWDIRVATLDFLRELKIHSIE
eukprot:scaffold2195_cov132-Cylindrotheca_fusiformis.AAC.14